MRDARGIVAQQTLNARLREASCQRQTQVFDVALARMMPLVPTPSDVRRMIRACRTCFCGPLRSPTMASRRRQSLGETSMLMPVRMPQIRMPSAAEESLPGLFRQVLSTSAGR